MVVPLVNQYPVLNIISVEICSLRTICRGDSVLGAVQHFTLERMYDSRH